MTTTIIIVILAAVALVLCGCAVRLRSTPYAIDWRSLFARLPLPMLALAASYGVYQFALLFTPAWVAVIQAAAFETTYIGLAVTQSFSADQRKRATGISIGAVAASVIYNTLAGWFHAQPDLLIHAGAIAWLCLAILHGAPLAWVAYLVADLLLHTAPGAVVAPVPQAPQSELEPTAPDRTAVPVSAELFPVYTAMLEMFDRNPTATTADLVAVTATSKRTVESRRSELVKLGALHRTPEGYRRNGVELVAE